ncbi:MAG: SDR family oxidoreductase [Pseudomonadota bacterium]
MHPAWQGKTAVITGGGSGIGRALAHALAGRGATVIVTDIDLPAAQKVAAECAGASAHALDVRDADAVRTLVEAAAREHGRLDYIFNNAGIAVGGETEEISAAAWDRVIDINLRGVINGVMAAYPIMLAQGCGHIVNTASLAGLVPAPLLTPYAMSKHAVVGLSTSLRIEAARRGVRVSVLCPAAIETPLLDTVGVAGLPPPLWIPNARRFLARLSGPPHPVARFAEEALAAILRNQAVIVIPGRARIGWRIGRLFPRLVEKISQGAVQAERDERKRGLG